MKCIFTTLILLLPITIFAQNKMSYQLGIGASVLNDNINTENYFGGTIDASFTYFSTQNIGFSFNSITGMSDNLSTDYSFNIYQQESFSLYYHLFRKHIFVGIGGSLTHIWNRKATDFNSSGKPISYQIDNRFLLGWSFSFTFPISTNDYHNLYLKAYRQGYFGANITGVSLLVESKF